MRVLLKEVRLRHAAQVRCPSARDVKVRPAVCDGAARQNSAITPAASRNGTQVPTLCEEISRAARVASDVHHGCSASLQVPQVERHGSPVVPI